MDRLPVSSVGVMSTPSPLNCQKGMDVPLVMSPTFWPSINTSAPCLATPLSVNARHLIRLGRGVSFSKSPWR